MIASFLQQYLPRDAAHLTQHMMIGPLGGRFEIYQDVNGLLAAWFCIKRQASHQSVCMHWYDAVSHILAGGNSGNSGSSSTTSSSGGGVCGNSRAQHSSPPHIFKGWWTHVPQQPTAIFSTQHTSSFASAKGAWYTRFQNCFFRQTLPASRLMHLHTMGQPRNNTYLLLFIYHGM